MNGCRPTGEIVTNMIVVENRESGAIQRFFVVDANVNLGCVQAGNLEQDFSPERLLRYYNNLEKKIYEYAKTYPDSFAYLPRHAYQYLMRPEVFEIVTSDSMDQLPQSWLIDQFIASPLSSISSKSLSARQVQDNDLKVQKLGTRSSISTRLYSLSDVGFVLSSNNSWGAILDASILGDLDKRREKRLFDTIRIDLPIVIRIKKPDEVADLAEWLVSIKAAGHDAPKILFSLHEMKRFGEDIFRLLQLRNSYLLTNYASMSRISSIIRRLKEELPNTWDTKLVFASGYPETQRGDSIAELISFFLSKSLNLTKSQLQMILGGNMLRLLPGRPPFLSFIETRTRILTKSGLGILSHKELSRIYRIVKRKNLREFCSLDILLSDGGGSISPNTGFLSVIDPKSKTATGVGVVVEKGQSLKMLGWNKRLSSLLDSRDHHTFASRIDSILKEEGIDIASITDLRSFTENVLSSLRIEADEDVLSSLHFRLRIASGNDSHLQLNTNDMSALGLSNGNVALALESESRRWWAARVHSNQDLSRREVVSSKQLAKILDLKDETELDLLKHTSEIIYPSEVVMRYSMCDAQDIEVLPSFFHLHGSAIADSLKDVFVGQGIEYHVRAGEKDIIVQLQSADSVIEQGRLGNIQHSTISYVPASLMDEFNLVICLETSEEMSIEDVTLTSPFSIKARLKSIRYATDEIEKLTNRILNTTSRGDIAIASIVTLLNIMVENKTPGRFSFITFDEEIRKFTIQKGKDADTSLGFRTEFSEREVRDSLFYSVLDSSQDMIGVSRTDVLHRAVAEALDDFGSERPTLVLIFATNWNDGSEKSVPFLKAISEKDEHKIDVILLDPEREGDVDFDEKYKLSIYSVESYSLFDFDKYVFETIGELVNRKTLKEP